MNWPTIAAAVAAAATLLLIGRKAAASRPATWRDRFLECARSHVDARTPYQWGGGHGGTNDWGLDCSGLVNECGQAAGLKISANSDWMLDNLPRVSNPQPGDLALYGSGDHAVHVRIVEVWHPGEQRAETIGAEGGDKDVTSPEAAAEHNAFVKRLPDHRVHSRSFLGFRTLEGLK